MPKGCDVAGGRKCHPREDRVHAVPAGPDWSTPCAKSEVEKQQGWNRRSSPSKGSGSPAGGGETHTSPWARSFCHLVATRPRLGRRRVPEPHLSCRRGFLPLGPMLPLLLQPLSTRKVKVREVTALHTAPQWQSQTQAQEQLMPTQ